MSRPLSKVAPEWWDYTTFDPEILADAAKLTEKSLFKLSRPGFTVHYYDTIEEFYAAEALEYVEAWKRRLPTILSESAVRSGRPNSFRSSRGLSMRSESASNTHIFGVWTNGSRTAFRSEWTILSPSPRPISSSASTGSIKNSGCRKRTSISLRGI